LIHAKEHIAGDFLISEYLTMLGLHTSGKKILGNLIGVPGHDLFPSMKCIFFLICFFPIDV
jgi:hypothetical protein